MAEYKHIIISKEILQNGGYYMVLIKRITAGVTAFALAAVMQGASLTAFSEAFRNFRMKSKIRKLYLLKG